MAKANTKLEDLASNIGNADEGGNIAIDEKPGEKRVRIMLEESDTIPPNGQFFGVDGKGYRLRAGEEAEVPESLINVLNTAVMSFPVMDSEKRIIGYRDRLRFPFRVITETRTAA